MADLRRTRYVLSGGAFLPFVPKILPASSVMTHAIAITAASLDVFLILNEWVHYVISNRQPGGRKRGRARARRRWCFLPFIPGLCLRRDSTWRLPQREMRELATSIRKVARVLWAVHVTFQEARQMHSRLCTCEQIVLGRRSAARAHPAPMGCLCHVVGSASKQSHGPHAGRVSGSSPVTLKYGV